MPKDHGLTLDDDRDGALPRVLRARTRACFYPELHDCFYNAGFLELAKATGARSTRSRR